ncbi:MAG: NTP transferase domain-containing protein [Actinobacteria bacterium]|nr:NTP transferase domain-containing protein [Actinomycetota bacterium]
MSAIRPAAVIILAAGEGTRMKSATPKVLHQICGQSMLGYVLAAARELDPEEIIVVAGHRREEVQRHLAEHAPDVRVVIQDRQGGTGHAVRVVVEEAGLERGMVVVTYGDTPVLRGRTLTALIRQHAAENAAATALTAVMPDPTGYGRVIRDEAGGFAEIVEEAEATPGQRAITEVNSGMYAFDASLLADSVKRLPTGNAKGEEYLTDVVAILRADGHHVASVRMTDPAEVAGVNDRAQLAQARHAINQRLLTEWMRTGVSVVDPATTMVDAGVSIGPDSEIGPGTQLEGRTVIGAGARVGPGCLLRDTTVGEGATVIHAVCESAVIEPGATVGPFAHLPPGTVVKSRDREPPGGMGAAARGTQRSEGVQQA